MVTVLRRVSDRSALACYTTTSAPLLMVTVGPVSKMLAPFPFWI
jgi:hypothetical protein